MFCAKCGTKVPDDAAFCGRCGCALNNSPQIGRQVEEIQTTQPQQPDATEKQMRFKPKYVIVAGALLVTLAGAFFGGRLLLDSLDYRKTLSDANESVISGDYERAIELYRGALAEKPNDESAINGMQSTQTEALSQGLLNAKSLVSDGKFDDALKEFGSLPIEPGDEKYEEYMNHLNALRLKPKIASIDSSAFPRIFVYTDFDNNAAGTKINASVSDMGNSAPAPSVDSNNNKAVITYNAEDSEDGGELRDISLILTIGEFTFPLSGSYVVPEFQDAEVTLISTDFSDYPIVHAFFRVEDPATKQYVANVGPGSFTITESVSGGAYVAREVKSAELLLASGKTFGLNIALVADKSNSISDYDLSKIKNVMRDFVGSLDLAGGDSAELIAFDDVPQLMCTFTDNISLLNNGISNMETDGLTAFYDAVYQGVRNASLKGGARCVIAFTDGEDNMSKVTANEVVWYANEKQVPLYIIGVGNALSSSQSTLKAMANSTMGRYWYIDDLFDLKEIYTQIYGELQELYVVSYESDMSADTLAGRDLQVSMRGGGYKGSASAAFSPSKTADTNGGGSRYEIFLEDVSWEDANIRCLERGGHLVTIESKEEEDKIIALAESKDATYVWLGGYTSYDSNSNVFGHWITGEDFTYQRWMRDEPSRQDLDGTPEWYIMLWNIPSAGGWSWNDQRNDPAAVLPSFEGKLAYVCEYE